MRFPFSKRVLAPELLDHAKPEEARLNLADIVRLNQRFGGHAVIRSTLVQLVNGNRAFTLLDVGCASGDTAELIGRLYPAEKVTSLDLSALNLSHAPHPKLLADAFHLPFKAASFDYVFCSLFLHHFQDQQVSNLLAGFYRVARQAVLICDLERHVLPYLFFPITRLFFGWTRITMHDGMASVRAAFHPNELAQLAKNAGITYPEVRVHRPAFRISVVGRKEIAGSAAFSSK